MPHFKKDRVDGVVYRDHRGRRMLWKRGRMWCMEHRRRIDNCVMCASVLPASFCEHLVPLRNCVKKHAPGKRHRDITPLVDLCLAASMALAPKHICKDMAGFICRKKCSDCEALRCAGAARAENT